MTADLFWDAQNGAATSWPRGEPVLDSVLSRCTWRPGKSGNKIAKKEQKVLFPSNSYLYKKAGVEFIGRLGFHESVLVFSRGWNGDEREKRACWVTWGTGSTCSYLLRGKKYWCGGKIIHVSKVRVMTRVHFG